ncbi:hypothetical protein BC830DRAFT_515280 [Chytriomyces sp. MP71]|nr:hypothetical protein BC830DRAFT_515280 [Chytriomyces sp. MP71]
MKEEKGDEVVAVSQSPRSTSIPAPDAATVLAPVPAPSSAPEVARRPSAALPARPVSVGVPVPVHPPPRPVVPSKPRPVTVAGEMTSPTSSTEQYHPTPTDASAVSQSYEGQTTAEGVEPPSVKPPQVQARNKALMGDLNRMLAGGPPKKSFGVSVEHAAEEGAESPIAGGGVPLSPLHSASLSAGETKAVEETWTDDSLATQKVDDSNPPLSPVSPGGSPPLVSPSPAAVKMKASAVSLTESRKSLTVNQAPPPVTPSPAAAAASGTAPALDPAASVAPSNSAGGEKKKGFMGMLSHLTKTRPKAGRVTAKKEDAAGGAAVAGTSDQAMNEHHDVEATTSGDVLAARSTDKVGSELELEEENDYNLAHSVVVQEPTPTGPTPAADEAIEQEESHEEEPAAPVSPSVETDTLPPRPPVPRPRPVPAPPSNAARVSISSDPRRASGIDLGNAESNVNLNPVPPPRPRPTPRPESVDRPVSAVSQAASLNEEAAAAVAEEYMRTSVAEEISAGTTGEERVSEEGAAQSENAAPARPLVPPKPPPKKIPVSPDFAYQLICLNLNGCFYLGHLCKPARSQCNGCTCECHEQPSERLAKSRGRIGSSGVGDNTGCGRGCGWGSSWSSGFSRKCGPCALEFGCFASTKACVGAGSVSPSEAEYQTGGTFQ